jgi:formylglycine-generating enzyme required for sulfatase activity
MARLTRYCILAVTAALLAAPAADAWAQNRIYLATGAQHGLSATTSTGQQALSGTEGTLAMTRVGFEFSPTDVADVQVGGAYYGLFALEAQAQLHPFQSMESASPYVYAGYGKYVAGGGEEDGVPSLGLGLDYAVNERLALNFQVGGRWTVTSAPFGREDPYNEVVQTVAPSIGLSYNVGSFGDIRVDYEKEMEETPVEGEDGANNQNPFANNSGAANDAESDTPFRDPTSYANTGTASDAGSTFEIPYSRDSLLQEGAEPLVIQPTENPPYEDPGRFVGVGRIDTTENGDMVRLPNGTFIMGLTDIDPYNYQNAGRKRITISSFYMDRYEVTNAEYREFLNDVYNRSPERYRERLPDSTAWNESISQNFTSYFYSSNFADYPVVVVTWEEAQAYCKWEGKRLPSEAEWEYAARAGRVGSIYPWAGLSVQINGRYLANFSPSQAGLAADGYAFTAPVGSFPPSRWGLHDMAGNVAEWVRDDYTSSYSQLSQLDPVYLSEEAESKVVRGGSWQSSSRQIGVGFRGRQQPDQATPTTGFRCAADVSQIEGTQQDFGPRRAPQQGGAQQPPQGGQQPPQGGQQPPQGGQQPPQQGGQGGGQQPPQQGGQGGGQQPPQQGGQGGQGGGNSGGGNSGGGGGQ